MRWIWVSEVDEGRVEWDMERKLREHGDRDDRIMAIHEGSVLKCPSESTHMLEYDPRGKLL